jgi:hypothetical protein
MHKLHYPKSCNEHGPSLDPVINWIIGFTLYKSPWMFKLTKKLALLTSTISSFIPKNQSRTILELTPTCSNYTQIQLGGILEPIVPLCNT